MTTTTSTARVVVDVHLQPDDLAAALRHDVRSGLGDHPRHLPPKWFYDDRGSDLFDQITRLDEYYPTRCEREILVARAAEITEVSGATTLIELGSGTSEKTLALLDAFTATGQLDLFAPLDVCEGFLRDSAATIAGRYPELAVHGIVGDFERHLHHLRALPRTGPRLVAFLGGTIGNLEPQARARFLADLSDQLEPGDGLLLGTDLVKDPTRLVRAYDDAAGVTAEFNRNVLHVVNRELRADFAVDRFAHVALWDADEEWIEMRLRSLEAQHVTIAELGLELDFAAGEELRTEISAKFTRPRIEAELAAAGLTLTHCWTDHNDDFAVSLSVVP